MFDDFHPQGSDREARRRLGGSIGAAVVMYGGLSVAVVAATATARDVVEEELTQVEFAEAPPEPPPPEPEPEAPPEVKQMRAAPKRPKLRPPKEISKEKLRESDEELAEADAPGPVDGSLDGVEGGKGTGRVGPPPKPKRPKPTAPVASRRNQIPTYDSKTRRKGIEGVVVVTFIVTASGETANVQIVSGPKELHALVRKAVARWRYTPATRDGKPIPWKKTERIRFQLH